MKPKYKEVDEAVYLWVCMLRSLRNDRRYLPLSRGIIKTRALYEAKRLGISNFKASDGWFWRWRWRYNILNSVRLHGEAGDVDLVEADKKIEVLKSDLAANGYKASNVFNMDETGVFYRTIPNRTYVHVLGSGDKRQVGRGTKMMKCKDRITVILCTNATGDLQNHSCCDWLQNETSLL